MHPGESFQAYFCTSSIISNTRFVPSAGGAFFTAETSCSRSAQVRRSSRVRLSAVMFSCSSTRHRPRF